MTSSRFPTGSMSSRSSVPPWAETDKYDIAAEPDGEGMPNDKQWKGMIQKLIVERYKFTFHRDKKELSVYVLSVAKTGPKLTKSEGDPNGLPGLFFRGRPGDLGVRNANMADFAGLLQGTVLDRPVVDQTGLTGRFDFTLNWTPDDSQFAGMGAKIPRRLTAPTRRHRCTSDSGADRAQARRHQGARRRPRHRPCREALGELGAKASDGYAGSKFNPRR